MMNNCWYIVKPEIKEEPRSNHSYLMFRHPVEPGTGQGGWMKPSVEDQIQDIRRQASAPTKQFTREEIEKHQTDDDCWIVVNNRVYDATSVLSWHPGGKQAIMPHAGHAHMDTTEEFESIHDSYAQEKLEGSCFHPAGRAMLTKAECIVGVVTKKCADYIKKDAEEKTKRRAQRSVAGPEVALKAHKSVSSYVLK